MTTATATTEKTALQIIMEVEPMVVDLKAVSSALRLMIEAFGFDRSELSDGNLFDIRNRHEMITDILFMTMNKIDDTVEQIMNLSTKKDSDE